VLDRLGIKLLGTPLEAIKTAEDRELFRAHMLKIGEPIPQSAIVETVNDAEAFAHKIGFPLIIRPAYTLGGTGGGIAHDMPQLKAIAQSGILHSRIGQILVEKSVAGWKEVEYEVMRDGNDTCITVCNMENIDPVGIHTGDSIVVAPSQTLSDVEYHMLRTSALKIIRSLGIQGGCNVQYALHPGSLEYVVIEVNPRVSRSSALASKAAGYPIAKVAAKIAVGLHLHEIPNSVTQKTVAAFEPALDYCVVKIPKWPYDKFAYADRTLGTQMKATGEVMAIDRNFESALHKAVTSLEGKETGIEKAGLKLLTRAELLKRLEIVDDERLFVVFEALRKGIDVETLHKITQIDRWFLDRFAHIVHTEDRLKSQVLNAELLLEAERIGFTDVEIKKLIQDSGTTLEVLRRAHDIYPVFKMVDTCAGEFDSATPYYYSTFEQHDESRPSKREKILVIGSGPIRIGQGIEFDYCSVHAAWAIQQAGYESIIINNNPETVSTDFDTADKLYFESLFIEDVMNVYRKELPKGVLVQFGGQTAINLAPQLLKRGVPVLGTSVKSIDMAEDRNCFERLLAELGIPQPKGHAVTSLKEGLVAAADLGYPVLVRPSYVIGGRAMQIVNTDAELTAYIKEAVALSTDHPILIDKYIHGIEAEVDAIGDGDTALVPGIMEHIEASGVHSGDSFSVYPAQRLSPELQQTMAQIAHRLARALQIKGLFNIQFVIADDTLYVIEVNPRASRTVPILSKVTGVPMVQLGVRAALGEKLKDMGYGTGLYPIQNLVAVKAPVFSFQKLTGVDVALGPEMKSTGEVLGVDRDYHRALIKAFMGAGFTFPQGGTVFASIREDEQDAAIPVLKAFADLGYTLAASTGTAECCERHGLAVTAYERDQKAEVMRQIKDQQIAVVINTPSHEKDPKRFGFQLRATASQYRTPLFTCLDTARAYVDALRSFRTNPKLTYAPMQSYLFGSGVLPTVGSNSAPDQLLVG
jgi:carbamoyl-phosphate synthase large subunit